MFHIHYDDAAGIVEIRIWSFLSEEECPSYAAHFRRAAGEARRRTGEVRIFIDARERGILPVTVAERIAEMEREVLTSDKDRVAVVVSSSLQKLQIRRIATSARTQSFLSLNAARTWLMAYAQELRVVA